MATFPQSIVQLLLTTTAPGGGTPPPPPPPVDLLGRGWDPDIDLGIDGDLFVDAVNGNDANSGTTSGNAKATLNAAINAATSGTATTIRVMGDNVKYREFIDHNHDGAGAGQHFEILGYGSDKPIITAQDVLSGWVPVSNNGTEQARIGTALAASGKIYKIANYLKTNCVDDDPLFLNLVEDNVALPKAISWAGGVNADKFLCMATNWYHKATQVSTDANGDITGYKLDAIIGQYTTAQIMNSILQGWTRPNVGFTAKPTGVVNGFVTAVTGEEYYQNRDFSEAFSLLNMLPDLEEGSWGWWDNGDGTVDLYLWPRSVTSLASKIERTARPNVFDISSCDYVTFKGLQMAGSSAGLGSTRRGPAMISYLLTKRTGVTVEHCRFYNIDSRFGANYACKFNNTDDLIFRSNTVDSSTGFGMMTAGGGAASSPAQLTTHADIQFNHVIRCASAGIRIYGTYDAVIAFNLLYDTGRAAHGNKLNCYEQCSKILIWGNEFVRCDGYATQQEADDIFWVCNFIPAGMEPDSNSSRSFVDQGNGTQPPLSYLGDPVLDCLFLNNTCIPHPSSVGQTADNGFTVTVTLVANALVKWRVANNLSQGWLINAPAKIDLWKNNWSTTDRDVQFDPTDVIADPATVWTNGAEGDFTYVRGGAFENDPGWNAQAAIDELKPWFQDRFSGWNADFRGGVINWAAPGIGAIQDLGAAGISPQFN